MLKANDAMPNLAVKDTARARQFYEGVLGLTVTSDGMPGVLALSSGTSTILVYESPYAGTNQATAMTWDVGDEVAAVVRALKDKGVKFEHYDMPGMKLEGDLHVSGSMKVAWFKDPDGNILGLVSG